MGIGKELDTTKVALTPREAISQTMYVIENCKAKFTGLLEVPKKFIITNWQKILKHDYSYFKLNDPNNLKGPRTLLTPTEFFKEIKKYKNRPQSFRSFENDEDTCNDCVNSVVACVAKHFGHHLSHECTDCGAQLDSEDDEDEKALCDEQESDYGASTDEGRTVEK